MIPARAEIEVEPGPMPIVSMVPVIAVVPRVVKVPIAAVDLLHTYSVVCRDLQIADSTRRGLGGHANQAPCQDS
jgi:hypothetical protein